MLLPTVEIHAQVFPVQTITDNGNRTNRIIFVFLSDGYQSSELQSFYTDAGRLNNNLFSQSPYQQYKNFFNCYAIGVPSAQSGAIHPGNASDEFSSGGQPVSNPGNYFQSTFDFGSIHRLLYPLNTAGLFSVLASNVADYDQVITVVNSPYYGGSGGSFATSSVHPNAGEIAIHELGHSFAGLADEYAIAGQGERPNRTAETNPALVKWKNWLGINEVGIYPIGIEGWQRPHQNCKMQFLGAPFCGVCSEAITDRIHQLVNMVDVYTPASSSFSVVTKSAQSFSVSPLYSIPSTMTVNWYLNGVLMPAAINQTSISVPFVSWSTGNNTVKAEVVDNTNFSKLYLPASGYVNSITWTVNRSVVLPIVLKSFSGKITSPSAATLNWEISNPEELLGFDVEKSSNGYDFTRVGSMIPEPGKSIFSFTDSKIYLPVSYYRLKMKDKDGNSTYSNVLKLSNPNDKFYYKLYQDAGARRYQFICQLSNVQNVSLQIFSIDGKEIFRKNFGQTSNQIDFQFALGGKPAGIYFAKIRVGASEYTAGMLAN